MGSSGNEQHAVVLLADIEQQAFYRELLEQMGFCVHVEKSAKSAIYEMRRMNFQLVLVSQSFLSGDSAGICDSIRMSSSTYAFILVEVDADTAEAKTAALQAGADGTFFGQAGPEYLQAKLKALARVQHIEEKLTSLRLALEDTNSNLQIASRRFEDLFHHLPVACFTVAKDGHIHEWNQEAERLFGIAAPLAFMKPVQHVLGDPSEGYWSCDAIEEIMSGKPVDRNEWSLQLKNGSLRHFVGSVYPFYDIAGKIIGAVSANIDITDRVQAETQVELQMLQLADMNRKLELLSITDGLTGLRNRRFFQDSLEQAMDIHAQSNRPLSLILFDIDHFKKYNDGFGHVAGDSVLRQVGKILRDEIQEPGLPARYGGEEFAVILPGGDHQVAMRTAERLRKALESASWEHRVVTGSFGVTTMSCPDVTSSMLIQQADEALYASKSSGRNCVLHHIELDGNDSRAA